MDIFLFIIIYLLAPFILILISAGFMILFKNKDYERKNVFMLNSSEELRKLILKYQNLPLLTFVSDDANSGDYQYMTASISCDKGWVLDAPAQLLPDFEKLYTDEEDLENDIIDELYDDNTKNLSDEEFDKLVSNRMKELEPYWKECIIIWVTAEK